jgi:predicted dehydrogenase
LLGPKIAEPMLDTPQIRVAIVGCGAMTESVHLPALRLVPNVRVAVLVDTNLARARALAERVDVPSATVDYREAIGAVDAAIVAVPHHFHAPITIDLLRGGVHVLVEKPMALNTRECDAMIEAADSAKRLLAVGLLRRFNDSLRFTKDLLDAGALGTITSVDIREGSIYRWNVTSADMFRRDVGGVLADIGSHVIDLLLWWFGDCQVLQYADDAMGGVEANCNLVLRLPIGVDAKVELSRTRNLRCTAMLHGTQGKLEVGTKTDSAVRLAFRGQHASLGGRPTSSGRQPPRTLVDLCTRELQDFVSAISSGDAPLVSGREGRRSVALAEACYAMRQPLLYPWEAPLAARRTEAVEA